MKDFEALKIEFKPEVREKILWRNGQKLLALRWANALLINMNLQ